MGNIAHIEYAVKLVSTLHNCEIYGYSFELKIIACRQRCLHYEKKMTKRIVSIDILRGFALLGILLMNITSFSMPEIAYVSPHAYGGLEWYNQFAYQFSHVFADKKFMGLFSLLFGASMMLLISKRTAKGQKTAAFHYKRNFWLLIIGLLHGAFLWIGDVLFLYAMCAFVLYFLRKFAPKWQIALGLFIFFIPSLLNIDIARKFGEFTSAEISDLTNYWTPPASEIAAEISHNRGAYWPQVVKRWQIGSDTGNSQGEVSLIDLFLVVLISDGFARAFGMMLIGMAGYTLGILTGRRSQQFYRRMLWIGFGVGIPVVLLDLWLAAANNWQASYMMFLGTIPNQIATPFIASGYIGLIMLWSKQTRWKGLQDRLAAVGRTALSNYIFQSLVAVTIFNGFGLYGSFNRASQLLFVVAIWLVQLWISPLWLDRFHFGPLEWAWRSLSHWKVQRLRRKPRHITLDRAV